MYQLNVIDGMGIEGKTRFLNRISQKGWRLTGGNVWCFCWEKGELEQYAVVPDRYFTLSWTEAGEKGWEHVCTVNKTSYYRAIKGQEQQPLLQQENLDLKEQPQSQFLLVVLLCVSVFYAGKTYLTEQPVLGILYWVSFLMVILHILLRAIMESRDISQIRENGKLQEGSATGYRLQEGSGWVEWVAKIVFLAVVVVKLFLE